MPELLSLTRAARLVGVTRGILQQKIKDGELPTFEGKVTSQDLLRSFPQARLEDNTVIERLTAIKDSAFAARMRERILPDPEVLLTRLERVSEELVTAKKQAEHYRAQVVRVQEHLAQLTPAANNRTDLLALQRWLQQWAHEALAPTLDGAADPLLVQDRFLRIMAAHVRIQPSNHEFFVEGSDSILDAALRSGLALDYGCSNGNCGLCKAKIIEGEVKKLRPHDYVLSEAEKLQGYALLCSHTAVTDLVIEAPEAGGAQEIPLQHIAARVRRLEQLNTDALVLHLQTPRTDRLRFLAGQHATLETANNSAELHIASCPCDDRNLQFHILRDNGPFALEVFTKLKIGDTVAVDGPRGQFLLREESQRPLAFFAFGDGFAPIKSLIEHAMALNAVETIHLCWLAPDASGHYLHNLCRAWADAFDDFHYHRVIARDIPLHQAAIEFALRIPNILRSDVYIAGHEHEVQTFSKALLGAGLPPAQLIGDDID